MDIKFVKILNIQGQKSAWNYI